MSRGLLPCSIRRRGAASLLAAALAVPGAGCAPDRGGGSGRNASAEIGRQPAANVHLHEKSSSALISWRQRGVRDKILLHLDAHADLDWLPDETIARIAAAQPAELADLELDPYSQDEPVLDRFASTNFVYAAARLGIVREMIWVVPDGALREEASRRGLVLDVLLGRTQMVAEDEAGSFRDEGRRIRGTLLGIPLTVCELDDLPDLAEPVLLDIDLDYFTVPSPLSTRVAASPWTRPRSIVERLRRHGVQSDLITLSLSTMGGFVPPESRWLVRDLKRALAAGAEPERPQDALRSAAQSADASGDARLAAGLYRQILPGDEDDPSLWYALGRALQRSGEEDEGAKSLALAERLDPLLARADLFEGDRAWLDGSYEAALALYERYLGRFPRDGFAAYAARKRAGCLARLNRTEAALGAFRELIEVSPNHAQTRAELGLLLRECGDLAGAEENLRAARRIMPADASYAMALGGTYLMDGRVQEAVVELEDAVARRPYSVQVRTSLASALSSLGRFDEAAAHLSVALALHPQDPQLRSMAQALRRRGVHIEVQVGLSR